MDTEPKNTPTESAEELEAEKQYQAVPKEDELRASIISEYGFDPEKDKERIDKIAARELDHKIKLSQAVGQKIKYRTDLHTERSRKVEPTKVDATEIQRHVNDTLEARDLEALEYPDDIKKAISSVAKINGISIRQAQSDPYIQSKIETWKRDQGADEAGISRTNRSGGRTIMKDDPSIPPDVDMNTEEGRKEYDAWLAKQIKDGN